MIDPRISALGPRIEAIASARRQAQQASRDVAAQLGHVRLSTTATAPPSPKEGQAQS